MYDKYRKETGDQTKTLIASTASPYKFTRSVMRAIGKDDPQKSDLELVDVLRGISGVEVPPAIEEIRSAEVRHETVCEVGEMQGVVRSFLEI